jgi:hypothetical protein
MVSRLAAGATSVAHVGCRGGESTLLGADVPSAVPTESCRPKVYERACGKHKEYDPNAEGAPRKPLSSRFRLVKPVDPTDRAVVDTIADWASTNSTVGIRIFLRDDASTDPSDIECLRITRRT